MPPAHSLRGALRSDSSRPTIAFWLLANTTVSLSETLPIGPWMLGVGHLPWALETRFRFFPFLYVYVGNRAACTGGVSSICPRKLFAKAYRPALERSLYLLLKEQTAHPRALRYVCAPSYHYSIY
jgi:hypothetical protein